MAKKIYSYLYVDNHMYINSEISLITLYYILHKFTKPFPYFERDTKYKIINAMPVALKKNFIVLNFIKVFVEKKLLNKRKTADQIASNTFGHCLLNLREGEVKIFNFTQKKVITIYPSSLPESYVKEQMNIANKAFRTGLGPKILSMNYSKKFVVEEYINFDRAKFSISQPTILNLKIISVLNQLTLTNNPYKVNLYSYKITKKTSIETLLNNISKLNNCNLITLQKITEFCLNEISKIEKEYFVENIWFGLSHGDFWEGNILLGKNNKIKVIDWNTLGNRNIYFDLYWMIFMTVHTSKHKYTVQEVSLLLEQCIKHFHHNLNLNDELLNKNIRLSIFFLDCIELKLQMICNTRTSNFDDIETWIERFNKFQQEYITN
ncbi:hypothetical protein E2R51_11345 [Jeotgalibacillus sp. S-D1]|uniref:phosphotransferase n=1 Tax=Jeotgalibacillus sp. S-D1 TaxID=2552189 RepID=UPI001059BD08|nr:phosphotransferase [Jeotgalibacillus sp. S-D1]TDL31811.1 hypothetical protein E2R51_11345 [Jeotgalibacillus sp. S-D1]